MKLPVPRSARWFVLFGIMGLGAAMAFLPAPLTMAAPMASATTGSPATASAQDIASLQKQGLVKLGRQGSGLVHRLYAPSSLRRSKPGSSAEATARTFLQTHVMAFFGRTVSLEGKPAEVELRTDRKRSSRTGTHLWRRQFVNGVAVEGGWVAVHLDPDGQLMEVESSYWPGLEDVDPRPTIPRASAARIAAAAVDAQGPPRAPLTTELVIDPHREDLVWKVTQALWAPYGDWCTEIDAHDGTVLQTSNLMIDGKDLAHAVRVLNPPTLTCSIAASPSLAQLVSGSGKVLPVNPLNGHPERYDLRDGDPVDAYREQKTLFRLDGSGLLKGAYVDAWSDFTTQPSEPTLIFDYSADFADSPFHAVNAYWHIDAVQDYLQTTLGIIDANNRPTRIFAHAMEIDNSQYSPVTDDIRFGDGGVDDAEDGEIVVHEYGHAIHENIVPNYTNSGETGAISEGFGDYLAASFGGNALVGEWDATSYNPGPPPYLRRTDGDKMYPQDLDHEIHDDGEIMSAVWWRLWNELGKQVADMLVIESLFHIGPDATFRDFANAMLLVDNELYSGIHTTAIYNAYKDRGIQPDYDLQIIHTALEDTEDLQGPYEVIAHILHGHALASSDPVQLYWRWDALDQWTVATMADEGSGVWSASIPGPGHSAVVEYTITAVDEFSIRVWDPIGGLENPHSFSIAMDETPPSLLHTPLADMTLQNWPPLVQTQVSDASEIAQVTVIWSLNGNLMGNFPLLPQGGDAYEAPIPYPVLGMHVGDQVEYVITATDASQNSNSSQSGPHDFFIVENRGTVLVLADDTAATFDAGKFDAGKTSPTTASPASDVSLSSGDAAALASDLRASGFTVSEEAAAASNPASWTGFDLLVLSFGENTSPAADDLFRQAVRDWVAEGGKLLVEGGEVAFDATMNPGYPAFAREVLHERVWKDDTSGSLNAAPQSETHPLRTIPNTLPFTLAFLDNGSYGSQDTVVPGDDAVVVYETQSAPATAGILVYDDDTHPASAQIVVWTFAYSALSNRADAAALAENTAHFLLAAQPTPTSSFAGNVTVEGMGTVAGLRVWAEPSRVSTTTDADGNYLLSPLYPGDYTVWAEGPSGWETAPLGATLQESQDLQQIDFHLRPLTIILLADSSSVEIPDGDPQGIARTLTVAQGDEVASIEVRVEIEHPWRGDLEVTIQSPQGTVVTLHNRSGSDLDNLFADYPDSTEVDGPGSLEDFRGEVAQGDWTLHVIDQSLGDAGRLMAWELRVSTVPDNGVGIAVSGLEAKLGEDGVHLSWLATRGVLENFMVRRSIDQGPWELRTHQALPMNGPRLQFVDKIHGLPAGSLLRYAIDGTDETGTVVSSLAEVSLVLQQTVGRRFSLLQNQPNPFNPATTIIFRIPEAERVHLRVYDIAGRLVTTLLDEIVAGGEHRVVWDGKDGQGAPVGSGTYFYELRTPQWRSTKAMVLLK